ncbi:MAG TPA: Crp/Fnr family transcriptional regulator [Bacteroidales bacterium]|nr:Crp/Fnr family transcriptional regulator [Bacteroidales bacterium]
MTTFHRSSNCHNCDDCNIKSPFFKKLSEEEIKIINENRFEITFREGENIIKQGTASSHMVMLTSGMAKMYIEGIDNRYLILELVKPWNLIGGPGIYVDNRYHYSVTALENCTACFIETANLKKVVRQNPDFAEIMLSHCSFNGSKNFERLVSIVQKQMHGRIADVLIYLMREVYGGPSFELSISRQDIGDLSGLSKDSAIRILKEFETEGIIRIEGRKINIQKEEMLQMISSKG